MATFLYKTRGNSSPERKPRVFFTCHPDDFEKHFEKICEDILETHDCAIFYTEDLNGEIEEEHKESDLGRMNLFVIPVTSRLLNQPNRAMDSDFRYAKENNIPVLPLMMESGLDTVYSRKDKFGELQYLQPYAHDLTTISYREKLEKYLESVLISDKMAERIRKAFDAYVFLSYRKKDRHYANMLMKMLHDYPEFRDIAIWYDEFLTPGESFRENIERMMKESKFFALLVTPSLLEYVNGKPNYVMAYEYPGAKEAGMKILPAEMEATDQDELRSKYEGIPDCVRPGEYENFQKSIADALAKIAISENNDDPEHNFLIGLAYLDGIDVEVDRSRGLTLIANAANSELIPAMKKMRELYLTGKAVKADYYKVILWQTKIVGKLRKDFADGVCDPISYIQEIYQLGDDYKRAGMLKEVYDTYHTATAIGFDHLSSMLSDDKGIDLLITGCVKTGKAAYLIKETDAALQFYDKAKGVVEVLKKEIGGMDESFDLYLDFLLIEILEAFAKIHQGEKNFEKAWAYINEALTLCRDSVRLKQLSASQKLAVGYLYISSAEISFDLRNYTQAENDYKTAVSLFEELYGDTGIGAFQETVASLYHRLSDVAFYMFDMDLKSFYENKASEMKSRSTKIYDEASLSAQKRQADELYEKGSYQKAYEIYRELANCGEVSVLRNLAFMYRMGFGVEKNVQEAITLYEKAIAAGDGAAATSLGMMYRDGNNVEKDEQIALELFERATELGDPSGRLLYQALKSKLDYEESKKSVKRFFLSSMELPSSDHYKKISEIVVGKETVSMLMDTEAKIAYLVRQDGRAIDKFSVWALGWGDSTSFDLEAEDDVLVLKEASFCRYDGYTEITVYKYRKIATEKIALEISHEENARGRKNLSIPATWLLGNGTK